VYETAEEVAALTPDPDKINNLGVFGIIATAPGDGQPQPEGHSKDQQNFQLQPASAHAPSGPAPQAQAIDPGTGVDFVSRYFCPGSGVFEDQATGSTHCTLIPYWMKRLHKTTFIDRQLSKRVGTFRCEVKKEQLYLKGEAVLLYKTSFAL
jgi:predicted PhzF superfamily epimerase YddE/YHI9